MEGSKTISTFDWSRLEYKKCVKEVFMDRFAVRIGIFALLVVTLVLSAGPMAYAQSAAGKQFKDVDVNKDGKVDAPELTITIIQITPEKFKKYDRNGDGVLDRNEFNGAGTAKEFRDVDYNQDGRIDVSEYTVIMMTVSPEWFKQFDRDGSGFLNEAEFNALMQKK